MPINYCSTKPDIITKSSFTSLFTVTDVLVHLDPAQVHLNLSGEAIETTPEHFLTHERGWVDAAISGAAPTSARLTALRTPSGKEC